VAAKYRAGLAGFLGETRRKEISLDEVRMALDTKTRKQFDRAFASARADAADANQKESARLEAIDLLALANDAAKVLTPIARTDKNQKVRLRAIAGLSKSEDIKPWKELLGQFYGETPVVQRAVSLPDWSRASRAALAPAPRTGPTRGPPQAAGPRQAWPGGSSSACCLQELLYSVEKLAFGPALRERARF
jgi:hypothetical protein